jgi:hypothetical protein
MQNRVRNTHRKPFVDRPTVPRGPVKTVLLDHIDIAEVDAVHVKLLADAIRCTKPRLSKLGFRILTQKKG